MNIVCGQNVQLLYIKLTVHIVTIGLLRVKQQNNNDKNNNIRPGSPPFSTVRLVQGRIKLLGAPRQ